MGKGYSSITLTIKGCEFLMKVRLINMRLNKTKCGQNLSLWDKRILLMSMILPSSARKHSNLSRVTQLIHMNHLLCISILCLGSPLGGEKKREG